VELTFQTAPLLALYQTSPGRGRVAPTLAMLMITPPSFRSMAWSTQALQPRYTPLTFTSNTFSNSSSVTVLVGLFVYDQPALFTRISHFPNSSRQVEIVVFQSEALVTSILWKEREEGFEETVSWPPVSLMSQTRTFAPSEAMPFEIPAPNPEPPPVIVLVVKCV
jgi:hypothetical protein